MGEKPVRIKAEDIKKCQLMLLAIGDENRQCIINEILKKGEGGMRVNDIAAKTNLSRPAVSRHLKVLKDAKIVKIHIIGTKNYYYYAPNEEDMCLLTDVLKNGRNMILEFPE